MERLKLAGKLPAFAAKDIPFSRVGIGFEKLDRDVFDPNKAYDKVARIGVKKIRIQSGWARTEKQEGVYDFAWLDEIVDNLLSRGLEPWICLCYGNPVYTDLAKPVFGAVGCPPISTEREMSAWLSYVKATVTHYKGRVNLFEIWNEPDCNYSWRHCENEEIDHLRNATEYGEFACRTAIAIKEANEEALAMGFALGHVADLEYVNRALATGLYRHLDLVSFHSYTPDEQKRRHNAHQLKLLINRYNPKTGLVQGETGAQSRSDGNGAMKGFAWTPEKQTKALLRGLVGDLAEGVVFTSYFSTMDMIEALKGRLADKATYLDYGYFGVIGAEFDENGRSSGVYKEKPSYYALQALASLFQGNFEPCAIPYRREELPSRRVNGTDCADKTVQIEGFRLHDGTEALVYWNAVDLLTATYEGTLSLQVYGQKSDNIRLLDPRDGSLYTLPEAMLEDLGCGGIRLKNIPLTDCPLVILFQ
ncbi:MAG: beta-galactosidase [Clostridia bacterium]|nr:beta-galactosidase [Clostridia bacterium]